MKRRISQCLAILLAGIMVMMMVPGRSNAATVTGYRFGTDPWRWMDIAASEALSGLSIPDLNMDELKLMMLAPAYNEAVAPWSDVAQFQTTYYTYGAPSPMAVGRADVFPLQYAGGVTNPPNPEKRDFWHTGIGMWQLDSYQGGMGIDMSMDQRIDSYASAKKVAVDLVNQWLTLASGLTPEQKRTEVWYPWHACGTQESGRSNCRNLYNDLYDSATRSIKLSKITFDSSVQRYGGLTWQTCNWQGYSTTFSCQMYDVTAAQGYTGSFYYTTNGNYDGAPPGYTPNPLTHKSIIFLGSVEYRYWLKGDTGYNITRWAQRSLGWEEASNTWWYTGQNLCVNSNCGTGQ